MCTYGSYMRLLHICPVLCRTARTSSPTACIQLAIVDPLEPLGPQAASDSLPDKPNVPLISTFLLCKYVTSERDKLSTWLLSHLQILISKREISYCVRLKRTSCKTPRCHSQSRTVLWMSLQIFPTLF